jgi:Rrf2 family protein
MVNQQFNFAVHILTVLAVTRGVVGSQTLARSVNTNPVVVRRLLLALRAAGLIETQAGKNGGAKLARDPRRITLLQIYEAVEPRPVLALNERKAARHCFVSCNIKNVMATVAEGAETAVRKHLRGITLHRLQQKIRRG